MTRHGALLGALLGGAGLLSAGCAAPPSREIEAAERQIQAAREGGADRFAPEPLKEAEDALARARRLVEERDYRSALSAANDAAERARQAVQATGPAREAVRNSVDLALAETRTALDRARTAREAAVAARAPTSAIAPLQRREEAVRDRLAGLEPEIDQDVLAAQDEANALRTEAAVLPDLYRAAREAAERARTRRGRGTTGRSPR